MVQESLKSEVSILIQGRNLHFSVINIHRAWLDDVNIEICFVSNLYSRRKGLKVHMLKQELLWLFAQIVAKEGAFRKDQLGCFHLEAVLQLLREQLYHLGLLVCLLN